MTSNFGNVYLLEHINLTIPDIKDDLVKSFSAHPSTAFYVDVLGNAIDSRSRNALHFNIGLSQFHILADQAQAQQINGRIGLYFPCLNQLKQNLIVYTQKFPQAILWTEKDVIPTPNNLNHHEKKALDIVNPETGENVKTVKKPAPTNSGQNSSILSKWHHRIETTENSIAITGPYGNQFDCFQTPAGYAEKCESMGKHPADKSFGDGMPFIEFLCHAGTAEGIGAFYESYLKASVYVERSSDDDDLFRCVVLCGETQYLVFQETKKPLRPYDNHHICIYIKDFEECYRKIRDDNLHYNNPIFSDRCSTWEDVEKNKQFRIMHIVDPLVNKSRLISLEHEIRPLDHPRIPLFPQYLSSLQD